MFHSIFSFILDGVEEAAHQNDDDISSGNQSGQATEYNEVENGDESEEMEDLTNYAEEDIASFMSLLYEENETKFPQIEIIQAATDNVDSCRNELRKTMKDFQDDDHYTK